MDLSDCAAREIELRDSGGERVLRRLFPKAEDVGEAAVEDGLEGGGRHGVFAFCSPALELCSKVRAESMGNRKVLIKMLIYANRLWFSNLLFGFLEHGLAWTCVRLPPSIRMV